MPFERPSRNVLNQLLADFLAWIEAGERILENHGNFFAHNLAALGRSEFEQFNVVKTETIGGNNPGIFKGIANDFGN